MENVIYNWFTAHKISLWINIFSGWYIVKIYFSYILFIFIITIYLIQINDKCQFYLFPSFLAKLYSPSTILLSIFNPYIVLCFLFSKVCVEVCLRHFNCVKDALKWSNISLNKKLRHRHSKRKLCSLLIDHC